MRRFDDGKNLKLKGENQLFGSMAVPTGTFKRECGMSHQDGASEFVSAPKRWKSRVGAGGESEDGIQRRSG